MFQRGRDNSETISFDVLSRVGGRIKHRMIFVSQATVSELNGPVPLISYEILLHSPLTTTTLPVSLVGYSVPCPISYSQTSMAGGKALDCLSTYVHYLQYLYRIYGSVLLHFEFISWPAMVDDPIRATFVRSTYSTQLTLTMYTKYKHIKSYPRLASVSCVCVSGRTRGLALAWRTGTSRQLGCAAHYTVYDTQVDPDPYYSLLGHIESK